MQAISDITSGQVPPRSTARSMPPLPRRERQILKLVETGETSCEIARQLGLSPRSVDSVVHRARLRLGAATRLQAAILAGGHRPAPSTMRTSAGIVIDDDIQELLRHLRDGATITAAAREVGMSRRTASRRLVELRHLVGAGSTAEAVVVVSSLLALDEARSSRCESPEPTSRWLDAG